ncbi:ras-related protein Rab-15-like [Brachionichthys hirsutus]|uniref:ras-related protein Rab-15-like n=1 Tax=Brachionichthys hirsutus TaxID=412623 RepID=UPI0036043C0F
MAKEYDVLFRLLILGDSGVGKTCILRRFSESEFDGCHISTIGVDFKMKTIEVDGIKVRMQIWDTAGQDRYRTLTKQYYRRAQGIVFVYDITRKQSFQHLAKWVSDVDEFSPCMVQRVLVGNKCDDELGRQVTKDQGSKLAKTYGMEFFETSASSGSNITEAFTRVAELLLQANKRDVDSLLGSLDDYLEKAVLDVEKGEQESNKTQRTCAC